MVIRDRNKTDNRNEIDTEIMKYLRFRLFVLLCVLAHSLGSFAYDFEVDGILYNILEDKNREVEVVRDPLSNFEYEGNITIPERVFYNGSEYRVSSIGYGCFSHCQNLLSVVIPNSVTSIGIEAFKECSKLNSITI